jgi:hypothetical protein
MERRFVLVDENPEAFHVMRSRLGAETLTSRVEFLGDQDLKSAS